MSEALNLVRTAGHTVRDRRIFFTLLPVAFAAVACLTFPHDVAWSEALMQDRSDLLRKVARQFSALGDFPTGTAAIVVVLWVLGWWKKKDAWRRAALACLLSAALAGLGAYTLKSLTGRPRPSAGVTDGFYGPNAANKFQSFGSAHTATSLGTTIPLAIALPQAGVPLLVLSLGVPWSRFYMHDHYVTDLVVGGGFAVWFGLAFGWAARRNDKHQSRL